MTTAIATLTPNAMTADQIDLLKRTVARGATDDELRLFLHACQRTGLDPFMRQIYAVKRWDKSLGREAMAIQTGIDGFRLVADRTHRYAPGREPSYVYDNGGSILSATAYVKKCTADGTWHEVAATAHYAEYAQTTKDGNPTRFWKQMPHVMLAKVAEALALRRAFPMELSGVYTSDEMAQADITDVAAVAPPPPASTFGTPPRLAAPAEPAPAAVVLPEAVVVATSPEPESPDGFITEGQRRSLMAALKSGGHMREAGKRWLAEMHGIESTTMIPATLFTETQLRFRDPAPLPGE